MKYLSIIILTLLFLGCQDIKKTEKPQNLIAKDMMVDILTDVYISNAARSVNIKRLKEYNISLDSIIYDKYHIDSLQFVESNAYYSSNLKSYTKIITSVEERLTVLQIEKDSIYEIIKKEKEKEDSIKAKKKEEPKLLIDPVESGIN
jgi:anion-transporting  ArsA/GET3 family ATPase